MNRNVQKDITTAELCTYFNSTVVLSQVMPSYVSHGWRVKKPFSELLPEVDSQGERRELSSGEKRKVKQCEIEWTHIKNNGGCKVEKKIQKDEEMI